MEDAGSAGGAREEGAKEGGRESVPLEGSVPLAAARAGRAARLSQAGGAPPERSVFLHEDERDRSPRADVASVDDVERGRDAAGRLDAECAKRMGRALDRFFGMGRRPMVGRRLSPVQDPAFLTLLDDDFPLFSEVTRAVREQALLYWRLASATGEPQPALFRPMLLVGKPGYGKTTYLHRLAELLGAPFEMIPMGTMSAGFVLSGADPTWSSAKPGKVFEAVAGGRYANPLILLDEIDKMSQEGRHRPDGPLYSLLERETASRFVDEFMGFPIDASRINWAATANSTLPIPDAILSRFEVFEIPEPDGETARATARAIYAKARREAAWGSLFDEDPSDAAVRRMADVSPREAVRMLGRAFGRAGADERTFLRDADFPEPTRTRMRIGLV